MKTLKKLVLFLIITISINSCVQKNDQIRIGIIQYANHPILDSVYSGISAKFKQYGDKYKIDYQVAHGDPNLNTSICKQMVKDSERLIIALGTPSAQAVANETKSIPIVFTAITDPVGAKLAKTFEKPEGNKTGFTDNSPRLFKKQIGLIKLIKPNLKKVGIITNLSESNCEVGMIDVRQALEELKIPYEEINASNATEIATSVIALSNNCDVFFISPSNVVYDNLGALKKEAQKKGIMIIGGDETAVLKYGSIATYTFDFINMGKKTAEMAINILDNNLKPGDIPISRPAETFLCVNIETATKLGLIIPNELIIKAKRK